MTAARLYGNRFRFALPRPFSTRRSRRAIRRGVLVWTALLILFSPGTGMSDRTLRCDGRLVSLGDFKEAVRDLCGEPEHIETWEVGHNSVISQIYDYETGRYRLPKVIYGPIHMARWTYDFGTTRLIHYLYFQNGELIRIETGDRGD